MIPAPLPENDAARLRALKSYELLDSRQEQAFDDVVDLVAESFEVPIALVSLIDAERQWFKAKCGLDACQTDRDMSFCAHAILEPTRLLVVPDARLDPRFSANPLVTGSPRIRFYAGCPLVDPDGYPLGTLCVIDTTPRTFSDAQEQRLRRLARLAMNLIEARKYARAAMHHFQQRQAEQAVFADRIAGLEQRLAERDGRTAA